MGFEEKNCYLLVAFYGIYGNSADGIPAGVFFTFWKAVKMEPLIINFYQVLRIVTILGLVATDVLMTAILYQKLCKIYHEKTVKFKWAFFLVAIVSSLLLIFIYLKLFDVSLTDPRVPSNPKLLF